MQFQNALRATLVMQLISLGATKAQEPSEIQLHALTAQLRVHNTCIGSPSVHDSTIEFFPSVRFLVGTCVGQHGNMYSVLLGEDATALYLLDSPSGFSFLIKRHTPIGLDNSTVVTYARLALTMQGVMSARGRVVQSARDLPDSIRSSLVQRGFRISPSHIVELAPGLLNVGLTVANDNTVATFSVAVSLPSGEAWVTERWRSTFWLPEKSH